MYEVTHIFSTSYGFLMQHKNCSCGCTCLENNPTCIAADDEFTKVLQGPDPMGTRNQAAGMQLSSKTLLLLLDVVCKAL